MTLKIDKVCDGQKTIMHLIGRIESQHLAALKNELKVGQHLALDLDEVTLVDVDVVRFLSACEEAGIELLHCSPYIREWVLLERYKRI